MQHQVECHAQRMLNPFHGVMYSVESPWADAITTDGTNWTIYVKGERFYDDLPAEGSAGVTVPDVKFGTWSERSGFVRAPIRLPTFDAMVCAEGDTVLTAVQAMHGQMPFPLTDSVELWLLDAESTLPLALLGACRPGARPEPPPLLRWTPGQACLEERPAMQDLRDAIARRAGPDPHAAWYTRDADGAGRLREGPQPADGHRARSRLPATGFPRSGLSTAGLSAQERDLAEEFHAWLAPYLLLLDAFSEEERRDLERKATANAVRMASQLALYPRIVDRHVVTAARVQARLRADGDARETGGREISPLSPFYLET